MRYILNQMAIPNGSNVSEKSILAMMFVLFASIAYADPRPVPDVTRGELLYSTHCIACHNTQVHWRDKKLATDRASLQAEVRRWQNVLKLGWGEDDIEEVGGYLNARYYHYPVPD